MLPSFKSLRNYLGQCLTRKTAPKTEVISKISHTYTVHIASQFNY